MSTTGSACNNMVTQVYSFNTWSKQKALDNGYGSSGLPYVGFPGLTLTPIPESPLLDSMLEEDEKADRDRWIHAAEVMEDARRPKTAKYGSLPKHSKVTKGQESSSLFTAEISRDVECGVKESSKTSCSLNVRVVQTTTFLPKDEPLTREEKRAHLVKLLLFALCGFVIVAGIALWIFSPAFT